MTDQQKNIQALLSSPEGKRLMGLLTADGGKALREAGSALKAGNESQAQAQIAPLLQNDEVQKLIKTMEKNFQRG